MGKKAKAALPVGEPTAAQLLSAQTSASVRSRAVDVGLLLSKGKVEEFPRLAPSRALLACSGHDITKRASHRKSKYLFAFPGRLGPLVSGGKVGTLSALDSQNPMLTIDFASGSLRLRGTIVPTRGRYLTLQCNAKAAKRAEEGGAAAASSGGAAPPVTAEDVFSKMVVFSAAEWIDTDGKVARVPDSIFDAPLKSPGKFTFQHGAGRAVKGGGDSAGGRGGGAGAGGGGGGAGAGRSLRAAVDTIVDAPRARRISTNQAVRYTDDGSDVEDDENDSENESDDDDGEEGDEIMVRVPRASPSQIKAPVPASTLPPAFYAELFAESQLSGDSPPPPSAAKKKETKKRARPAAKKTKAVVLSDDDDEEKEQDDDDDVIVIDDSGEEDTRRPVKKARPVKKKSEKKATSPIVIDDDEDDEEEEEEEEEEEMDDDEEEEDVPVQKKKKQASKKKTVAPAVRTTKKKTTTKSKKRASSDDSEEEDDDDDDDSDW